MNSDISKSEKIHPFVSPVNAPLAYPRLCALCGGSPSTLSQSMHNAGFRSLGLPFVYVAFDTADTAFALRAMRELGIRGYSMTIPHKELGLSLVDEPSAEAIQIGAVNTVINCNGYLKGYNTDVYGIAEALTESGVSLRDKRVLLLGGGGAARSAISATRREHASELVVWNRTAERFGALINSWPGLTVTTEKFSRLDLEKFDVVINSTPLGSKVQPASASSYPFALDALTEKHVVFDMVTRATPLTEAAQRISATVIFGVRMLLFQAIKQFALFTEVDPPLDVMEKALHVEIDLHK